jgi:hypothetical protein
MLTNVTQFRDLIAPHLGPEKLFLALKCAKVLWKNKKLFAKQIVKEWLRCTLAQFCGYTCRPHPDSYLPRIAQLNKEYLTRKLRTVRFPRDFCVGVITIVHTRCYDDAGVRYSEPNTAGLWGPVDLGQVTHFMNYLTLEVENGIPGVYFWWPGRTHSIAAGFGEPPAGAPRQEHAWIVDLPE